ncbi:MAG TPA: glycerophosphodiester phosphodiesterase [Armatimonadota bacterium]|jgi:glycerophosphoryl diester phosphodiesterase
MPVRPIVIAHRGASGYRPEHTLASYELAIEMGADFVEPDLVSTRDGVLVARHENEISGTTDVSDHPEFADRRATKQIDGRDVTGWFTEDFTFAELRTLRAKERIPKVRPNNTVFDGRFPIPSFEEILELVAAKGAEVGRTVGVYPETKYPSYFHSLGLALEPVLARTLTSHGLVGPDAPVYIQSFEVANLRELSRLTQVPLVLLVNDHGRPRDFTLSGDPRTYADLTTPEGLAEVATYARGIGPHKDLLLPRDADGRLAQPTSLVTDAHAAGLTVHPWTFRAEDTYLPSDLHAHPLAEMRAFLALGIDGFFTDNPDVGVAARG